MALLLPPLLGLVSPAASGVPAEAVGVPGIVQLVTSTGSGFVPSKADLTGAPRSLADATGVPLPLGGSPLMSWVRPPVIQSLNGLTTVISVTCFWMSLSAVFQVSLNLAAGLVKDSPSALPIVSAKP